MTRRQLVLGAYMSGSGTQGDSWRHPRSDTDGWADFETYARYARTLERGRFDALFFYDNVIPPANLAELERVPTFPRWDPVPLIAALAVVTRHIGLIATVSTSYNEPYNVARQFAAIDRISKGRAGWNVVTSSGGGENFNLEHHLDHALRYERAHEFFDVVRGLWDSYEDDAFPRDKQSGVFLDKAKQHRLDHKGTQFSVRGPLALTRSKQGQPVIFQAGESTEGRDLGAAIADGTLAAAQDFESGVAYYADLKARAAALGRNPDHIKVLPGLFPIIADTDEEAQKIARVQHEALDLDKLLVQLGRAFNYHDFRQYDLDAPFPDLTGVTLNSYKGHAERIIATARGKGLTLREAAYQLGQWRTSFVGSPETIADEIERWFTGRAADGFNLRVTRPADFALFRERVVPILQARGLFRTEYTADTLRGHLGVPVPPHRHANPASATAAAQAAPKLAEPAE